MTLIDKDTLVAKIKKYYEEHLKRAKIYVYDANYWIGKADAYHSMLEIIDTFEVKEVDLEKEIKNVQRKYKTIDEYEDYPCTMYANDIKWIAKHFFELGLIA